MLSKKTLLFRSALSGTTFSIEILSEKFTFFHVATALKNAIDVIFFPLKVDAQKAFRCVQIFL